MTAAGAITVRWNRLDCAQTSAPGQLMRRAVDLQAALNLGINIGPDDITAGEFYSMLPSKKSETGSTPNSSPLMEDEHEPN